MKRAYSIVFFLFIGGLVPTIHLTGKKAIVEDDGKPYKIYLTFDDGPLQGSENIADAITKEKVPITVFVVGTHIGRGGNEKSYFEEYVKNPLIEVGNHSFSHAHNKYKLFYSSAISVYDDFLKCYQENKLPTRLCRLPGRNMWRTATIKHDDMISGANAADLLYESGYTVVGWDLEWRHDDHTSSPVQTVQDMAYQIEHHLKNNATRTKGHLVLLSHDEMFAKGWEESELKQLIDTLKSANLYEFEFISKYPNLYK